MSQHILNGVFLAILSLVSITNAEDLVNKQLVSSQSLIKNNFAYEFFDIGSKIIPELRNVSIVTHNTYDDMQCYADINAILNGIRSYKLWALQYPDSWGRFPFGVLWGHLTSMGQYGECITAIHKISENHAIRGKYCTLQIPLDSPVSYLENIKITMDIGVCIPKTCSPTVTNEIFRKIIKTHLGKEITTDLIHENLCDFEKPVKLRAIDIVTIVLISFFACCIIASSIYDFLKTKKTQPKNQWCVAFSVLTNAPKMFTVKKVDNPDVIYCLSGIRCITMLWVIIGHSYINSILRPNINTKISVDWFQSPHTAFIHNSDYSVDTFLFISGFLLLWGVFREMEKNKGYLNIKIMYLHRYIRLTPVIAVVILYVLSLFEYTVGGPMWMKYKIHNESCKKTWWAFLLYFQNYIYPDSRCMPQLWYLAVDTQLYLLSPLLFIPLWKWGKKALIGIVIIILVCTGLTFFLFSYNGFSLFYIRENQLMKRMRVIYHPTHIRISTWLIGVIFAYIMFTKNRGRKVTIKKQWVIVGWLMAFGVMFTNLYGTYWRIHSGKFDAPIYEVAIYEALKRNSWVIAVGWVVWACYNGHAGVINDFLSWKFFISFSRFTYSIYVIHIPVQIGSMGRLQTDTKLSDYDNIGRFWQDLGLSCTVSLFTILAIEVPISIIEKVLFHPGVTKSKSVKHVTASTENVLEENSCKA